MTEADVKELEARLASVQQRHDDLQSALDELRSTVTRHDNGDVEVHLRGFDLRWRLDEGIFAFAGLPAPMMWADSTLAGLMAGVQAMVGTRRFGLALQSEGRKSCEEDWKVISQHEDFTEGFRAIATVAALAGWGKWEISKFDREHRQVVFSVRNGWEGLYQKALGVCWGSGMVAGKFAGYCTKLFSTPCWAEQTSFIAQGDGQDVFVVAPSDRSLEGEMEVLVAANEATRDDMSQALQRLREEIERRSKVEKELQSKLTMIQQQRELIAQLSTPVMEVWNDILVMPIVGVIDGDRAAQIVEELLTRIVNLSAQYVLIDITGVSLVDAATAGHLLQAVSAAKLLGARAILTGISPAAAETLAALGGGVSEMETAQNLKQGLRACIADFDAHG